MAPENPPAHESVSPKTPKNDFCRKVGNILGAVADALDAWTLGYMGGRPSRQLTPGITSKTFRGNREKSRPAPQTEKRAESSIWQKLEGPCKFLGCHPICQEGLRKKNCIKRQTFADPDKLQAEIIIQLAGTLSHERSLEVVDAVQKEVNPFREKDTPRQAETLYMAAQHVIAEKEGTDAPPKREDFVRRADASEASQTASPQQSRFIEVEAENYQVYREYLNSVRTLIAKSLNLPD